MRTRTNCLLLVGLALLASAESGVARIARPGFDFDDVDARAKELANTAFKDAGSNLPGPLQHLDHDRYQAIRFKPSSARWHGAKLPFELQFFHEGWLFDRPVKLNEINAGAAQEIAFNPQAFDYTGSGVAADATQGLGYSGFRAHYALNLPGYKDDVLAFLGASYFRALGIGQLYGLSARGLAIDTAQASGEEFPRFVEFWIERPKANAPQLAFYALLDSPRATGAYRFVFTPGADSTVEVTARVYLRDKIDKLGIAPLTSMYFHGSNQRAAGEDYRPEVHDSDGLSIQSKNGEWLWRPLVNPKRLLVTSFALDSPRGFGLMQRERNFESYEDLSTHYEAHPSAWIEPIGEWGPGRVELVQIPAPDETNDNIVAYWVPAQLPAKGQPLELTYRVHWQNAQQIAHPPGAWVTQTRAGRGFQELADDEQQFVVDFTGPALDALPADAMVKAVVSAPANGEIVESNAYRVDATGQWRTTVRVRQVKTNEPTELRGFLQSGDNVLTETWSNVLPPLALR